MNRKPLCLYRSFAVVILLKFGRYCKLMLPRQKAGVYRLENSP